MGLVHFDREGLMVITSGQAPRQPAYRRFTMDDDLKPRPKPPAHEIGSDLATLSIHELAERIDLMKTEIRRLETAIAAKTSSKSAAESVFKF
ncbi:MAG: DUF1192 domain-containing protein [Phreatobacter sp.]